jgi:hypothetical protein
MRARTLVIPGLAALLVAAAACSSNSDNQPAVRNYGPEAGTGAYATPAYPAPASAPAPSAGPIRWYTSLAQAQAAARSSGRLILALATRPGCGICRHFKTETAPAVSGELTRIAVPYTFNLMAPEAPVAERLLRSNLRGADLMPLVGFLTADLQWVNGFWGQRSVSQFRGDIARAASLSGMRASLAPAAPAADAPHMAMVVNEYGEREWGRPGDIWPTRDPEPVDAITGEPAAPSARGAAVGGRAPTLADAGTPAPSPVQGPAPNPAQGPAPSSVQGPAPSPVEGSRPLADLAPLPADTRAPSPSASAAPAAAGATAGAAAASEAATAPSRAPGAAEPHDATWGQRTLERARTLIASGHFDQAHALLAQVRDHLTDTALAREAGRGTIALYDAKRIRMATSGTERTHFLTRARRDLGRTMWGELFLES